MNFNPYSEELMVIWHKIHFLDYKKIHGNQKTVKSKRNIWVWNTQMFLVMYSFFHETLFNNLNIFLPSCACRITFQYQASLWFLINIWPHLKSQYDKVIQIDGKNWNSRLVCISNLCRTINSLYSRTLGI